MFPVIIPMLGVGMVRIDAADILRVNRNCAFGPRLFLKGSRELITTPEALARLERMVGRPYPSH
jgi:hypothetical protein